MDSQDKNPHLDHGICAVQERMIYIIIKTFRLFIFSFSFDCLVLHSNISPIFCIILIQHYLYSESLFIKSRKFTNATVVAIFITLKLAMVHPARYVFQQNLYARFGRMFSLNNYPYIKSLFQPVRNVSRNCACCQMFAFCFVVTCLRWKYEQ